MKIAEKFPEMIPHIDMFIDVCHRLYAQGLVCAYDGNVSMRFEDYILMTPTHLCKGDVCAEDVVAVSVDGRQVLGKRQPSSEFKVHLAIYNARIDIRAVIHSHPLYATAIYRNAHNVETSILMEAETTLGKVPLIPYISPGSQELADAVGFAMKEGIYACVLERHGVVTCAKTLLDAYFLTESLERLAKTETILATVNY